MLLALQVVTRSDLVMIVTYPSGERITQHSDGTRMISHPDGSWVVESPGVAPVECRNGCTRVVPGPDTALEWQHESRVISVSLPGGRNVVATCGAAVLMPTGGGDALATAVKVLPGAREQAELDRITRIEKRKAEREVWGVCWFSRNFFTKLMCST
jgi:hypothetical protein